MKVTIAQLNPTVGDLEGNFKKMIAALEEGRRENSDLLIFPELFVTGYPPGDLLLQKWFMENIDQMVEKIIDISSRYPQTGILFGVPRYKSKQSHKLYNCAMLVCQGQVLACQHKSLIPAYDVFMESRYFEPAAETEPVEFKGEKLGISICEDAWNSKELSSRGNIHAYDNPIDTLAQKGATLLVNISASPFSIGKDKERFELIRSYAVRHHLGFVYVNQVGSNDELIFDGRSMYIDRTGKLAFYCPGFEEQVATFDTAVSCSQDFVPQNIIESVYLALVLGIRDYMQKCRFNKIVIGMSGGIDSAVVGCLASAAAGAENVLTISMPSPHSSRGSVEDSRELAVNLGMQFKVVSISDIYDSFLGTLGGEIETDPAASLTEQNLQARIRGNILMAFSNKFGYLLLSTGNKSELATGYCTLYGDMCGGLAVLADLPKTMVYELADYINREKEVIPREIIIKPPSAELKPDQVDQDELPPYPVLDKILQLYIEDGCSVNDIIKAGFEPDTVKWVVQAIHRSEYKRSQAPISLKLTTKAFGSGRRMPIAARIQPFKD